MPSLPLPAPACALLSQLSGLGSGADAGASHFAAGQQVCGGAVTRAGRAARARHKWNEMANLSRFPTACLLFVCEEDKCNCFNLRNHKGSRIFFFVTDSESDMKAFQYI